MRADMIVNGHLVSYPARRLANSLPLWRIVNVVSDHHVFGQSIGRARLSGILMGGIYSHLCAMSDRWLMKQAAVWLHRWNKPAR